MRTRQVVWQLISLAGIASTSPVVLSGELFRDPSTGEVYEKMADGTFKPFRGDRPVHQFKTGQQFADDLQTEIYGLELKGALDAAAGRGAKQEPTSSKQAAPPPTSSVLGSQALHCLLDDLPGTESDMAASAISRSCQQRFPNPSGIPPAKETGWFAAHDTAEECLADKAKTTRSDMAVRTLAMACGRLYGK